MLRSFVLGDRGEKCQGSQVKSFGSLALVVVVGNEICDMNLAIEALIEDVCRSAVGTIFICLICDVI